MTRVGVTAYILDENRRNVCSINRI